VRAEETWLREPSGKSVTKINPVLRKNLNVCAARRNAKKKTRTGTGVVRKRGCLGGGSRCGLVDLGYLNVWEGVSWFQGKGVTRQERCRTRKNRRGKTEKKIEQRFKFEDRGEKKLGRMVGTNDEGDSGS